VAFVYKVPLCSMLYRFVCWFVQHDHDIAEQIIYPCMILNGDPDKLLYTVPVAVLVDNQEVCRCHDIFSAACAMFACYYMFDICYPAALENIFLFLDSHVTNIEKRRITPSVQRKINAIKLM